MKKWSTVDDTITCGFELKNIKSLFITYKQKGNVVLTRTKDDVTIDETNKRISFTWKQSDWEKFTSGKFTFALTVLYDNSDRIDTERFESFVQIPEKNEVI